MAIPHRIAISLDDLDADFDSATVARGVQYADEGRVRDATWCAEEWVLTGSVLGSGNRVYRTEVGLDVYGPIWAACSCPVGAYCKHAVALLLTGMPNAARPVQPDRWRSVLASVLDEVASSSPEVGAPIGLEFSVTPATAYVPVDTVTVRPLTIGKRGTWVKRGLNWRRVLYNPDAGEFNSRQYLAVQALALELERSYPVIGETMMLTGASPALWALLTDAADAGVAIVADRTLGLHAVEFIKDAQLRLNFVANEAGGAVMSVSLVVDGEQCDPAGVGLIGMPTAHGLHQVVDGVLRLGRFDPPPGRTIANLIARDEQVYIPADMSEEFSLGILPRLAEVVPIEIEEGLFTPPTVLGPIPVLTIKLTGTGARAYWSTRYDVNDQHQDFDPDSPAQLTGYRDAAAEDLAWQRVLPALRAVAAASRTWKHQAAQHVKQRMHRMLDAAIISERRAIDEATDAVAAAAAASTSTLRSSVDLTIAEAAVLCGEILPQLDCLDAFTVEIEQGAPHFRAADSDPQLEFSSGDGEVMPNDWFNLNITVQVDGQTVPLSDVIVELASGATHMLLPTGVYFRLDTPELLRLRELLEEARALGEIEGDSVNARTLNVTLWDELLALGVVDEQVANWHQTLKRLTAARPPVPVELPVGLVATLRDYQRDGLNWLSFLWDNGLGGVLADDMGLGKTVQALALIARAAEAGAGKFLVVTPSSVVTNWAAECRKFTPGLNAAVITTTGARSSLSLAEHVAAADIVITSYALMRIDFDAYAQIEWAGVILDEAQFVKNHNSKTHQCARRLEARFKLAITGTPMENNLMELWSLLSITAPGLFPSPKAFTDYFRKPIESGSDKERLPVLRRRIKPLMLRRTKAAVAPELPPKQEQVLTVDLGAKHRKIYDTRLARERQKVLGLLGDWEKNRFEIFRSLTLLRQLSLHAGLVDESNIDVGSAKVDFLVEQLTELLAEGHGALVFSQFTRFLGILRSHLDAIGLTYSYLDGSLSARERAAAIAAFKDGSTRVFLISLKAGGFGLNLTEADYCFVCDPWWSPAAEAQAIDRTHRIGQTRPVTVYRLVSEGTIEERVVALQERKRELFTAVVDDGEVLGSAITASDIRALLG
jgi:superfamily II DNA or RNA helicase